MFLAFRLLALVRLKPIVEYEQGILWQRLSG